MSRQQASWEKSLDKKRKKINWKPRRPPARVILLGSGGSLGVAVVALVALFLYVNITTGSAVAAADEFLAAVAGGEIQKAYAATAAPFKDSQPEERFARELKQLELQEYYINPWWERIIPKKRDGYRLLTGTLKTDEIDSIYFLIQIAEEGGTPRVLSFVDRGREDVGAGAWFTQAPDAEFTRALARQTMSDFAQAVIDKDLAPFYEGMSQTFKIRQNMDMMNNAFGYLIDSRIDLAPLKSLDPVFDATPQLEAGTVGGSSGGLGVRGGGGGGRGGRGGGGRGGISQAQSTGRLIAVLVASGTFPFEPEPVKFTFRYRYQHPDWKVHNIFVDVPGARESAAQ